MSGEPPQTATTMNLDKRHCSNCDKSLPRPSYSKNQWKKGAAAKCKSCVESSLSGNHPQSSNHDGLNLPLVVTNISLDARPQQAVPGFDSLTYCTDWPQTRKGEPPNAQSAVFNPLLACVLGPIENYCTDEQLAVAMQWWTAALPAWPRWVAELQKAGVDNPSYREKLLKNTKGQPNPLIHKAKGRGT